jgi:hypothetical protein
LPKLATEPFLKLWEQEVFKLLLIEGKITDEIVANIRSWQHSGFSVDQSVRVEAKDTEGLQRLIQYFLRCPFSQARMIEVTGEGKVIYKMRKRLRSNACKCANFQTKLQFARDTYARQDAPALIRDI